MICYVLAMGKQHLGPHVVVGYGIKIFWPGLFITSPDHLVNNTSSRSRTLKSPILLFKISRDSKIHAFPCNKEIYLYKKSYSTVLEHV